MSIIKIICDLEGNQTATEFNSNQERLRYQQQQAQQKIAAKNAMWREIYNRQRRLANSFSERGLNLSEHEDWLQIRSVQKFKWEHDTYNTRIAEEIISDLGRRFDDIKEYEAWLKDEIANLKESITFPWLKWGYLQMRLSYFEEILDNITP